MTGRDGGTEHDTRCTYERMRPISHPCTCAKLRARDHREAAERALRRARNRKAPR